MKIKIRFNKRYGVVISILACASALWMMVHNFNYPVENLINIAWFCLLLLLVIILIAAPLALVSRWLADRSK